MKILSIVLQSLGGFFLLMQILYYWGIDGHRLFIESQFHNSDKHLENFVFLIFYNSFFMLGAFLLIAGNRLQKKYIEKKVKGGTGNL
jgi:hypothetical protein